MNTCAKCGGKMGQLLFSYYCVNECEKNNKPAHYGYAVIHVDYLNVATRDYLCATEADASRARESLAAHGADISRFLIVKVESDAPITWRNDASRAGCVARISNLLYIVYPKGYMNAPVLDPDTMNYAPFAYMVDQ